MSVKKNKKKEKNKKRFVWGKNELEYLYKEVDEKENK
jgi:hypothetical protein